MTSIAATDPDLLTRIKKSLEIDLDLSPLVDNLSIALNAPKQQDPIELIRKSVNSHHEMVNKCQNDLQNLEAMHEEAIADYTNNQDEIKRREKQNKKVSTKLLDSEGFLTNFLEAIDTTIELTKIQRNMHQQLFDLTKVALHTELAVPYPFHPDPTGREGVVSLNTTDNIDAVSTEETKPKGKGSCKKHKVSSRSSGNDDPDNDQDREAIIENKRDTNEQTSYYNLANYYFGWIYQLPKWLQSTLLNSRPIKEFIKTLNYNNRFVEKPTTLEKDLCAKLSKTQDHEYEYNFNQKVQINYDDNFNPFELTTIRSAITIGLILPIFMEQKDHLLGLGNNFIEI